MTIRHAIKSAIAAVLALLAARLASLLLPGPSSSSEAWAVLSAVVVMQANLGNSLKASGQRVLGTAVGVLTGAALAELLGHGPLSLGLAIGLTVVICTRLNLTEALRIAGATTGVVLLSSHDLPPWEIAFARLFDVMLGIGAALLVQSVLWPERAGRLLRQSLAASLNAAAALYEAVLGGEPGVAPPDLDATRAQMRDLTLKNRDLLRDLQREPGQGAEAALLAGVSERVEEVVGRVLQVEHNLALMAADTFYRQMDDVRLPLVAQTLAAMRWAVTALTDGAGPDPAPGLAPELESWDNAFRRLRSAGAFRAASADEIVRACSFLFNVRATSQAVQALAHTLAAPAGRLSHAAEKS